MLTFLYIDQEEEGEEEERGPATSLCIVEEAVVLDPTKEPLLARLDTPLQPLPHEDRCHPQSGNNSSALSQLMAINSTYMRLCNNSSSSNNVVRGGGGGGGGASPFQRLSLGSSGVSASAGAASSSSGSRGKSPGQVALGNAAPVGFLTAWQNSPDTDGCLAEDLMGTSHKSRGRKLRSPPPPPPPATGPDLDLDNLVIPHQQVGLACTPAGLGGGTNGLHIAAAAARSREYYGMAIHADSASSGSSSVHVPSAQRPIPQQQQLAPPGFSRFSGRSYVEADAAHDHSAKSVQFGARTFCLDPTAVDRL